MGASYVKWVESAGGRVVPIRFYASDAELYRLFKSVNGLIFPVRGGCGRDIPLYNRLHHGKCLYCKHNADVSLRGNLYHQFPLRRRVA